jgi:hypothetical protein
MAFTFCPRCNAKVEWAAKCSQCGAEIPLYRPPDAEKEAARSAERPTAPGVNEVRLSSSPRDAEKEATKSTYHPASSGAHQVGLLLRSKYVGWLLVLLVGASFLTAIITGVLFYVRSHQPPTYSVTSVGDYYDVTCEWTYKGSRGQFNIQVSKEAYEWFKTSNADDRRTFVRAGDFSYYVVSSADDETMKDLANCLSEAAKKHGWDEMETVGFLLSYVQAMPYTSDKVTTGYDEYPRYPIETIVDGGGDCEDTSILLASLVRAMGYDVVLLELPGHMAVGFPLSEDTIRNWPNGHHGYSLAYYTREDGRHWAYCETTGEGWRLGQMPDDLTGSAVKIMDVSYFFQHQSVVDGTITVDAGSYKEFSFDVDTNRMRDAMVAGNFAASSAGGTFEVFIMDDIGFDSWKVGRKATGLGYVGKAEGSDFSLLLSTSGRYHLIYNSASSSTSSIDISTNVFLQWIE